MILFVASDGRVESVAGPTIGFGDGEVAGILYCDSVSPGLYRVHYIIFSDLTLSDPVLWSTSDQTRQVVC